MDTVEKMKLHIKSEPEIKLEIPNPSDQLKQFAVEKALMHAFQFAQAERPSMDFSKMLWESNPTIVEKDLQVEYVSPSQRVSERQTMPDIDVDLPVQKIPPQAVRAAKEIAESYEPFNPIAENKRHDSLEVVHEESNGFGTTIGERMKAAMNQKVEPVVEENDPSKTGFKIDGDGTKRYKVRYKCPNNRCKTEANHFVPEGVKEVNCHDCGTSMKVRRATQDAELTPDPYLNFFIAGSRTPYYEYHHNK